MKRVILAIATLSLAACHGSSNTTAAKPATPPPAPAPAAAPAPAMAVAPKPAPPPVVDPTSPQAVLSRLHAFDSQELEVAQLGKTAASKKQAKSLAADVVSSRTKLDAQVTTLAKKLNVTLVAPETLNLPAADKQDAQAVQTELAALKSKKGTEFDTGFVSAMEDADKREDALLSNVVSKTSNADLKSLATSERTALQKQEKVADTDMKALSKKSKKG